jgi:UDP-N-acetylmuramate dehydrogenase
VGAGKNLDTFLRDCHSRGIFDIQSLSSIPGSVGAGAFGNVGAFGKEIKNFISGIFAFDILKKEFVFIENKKCYFSYRDSFFKKNRIRFVVFSVVFDFSKKFQKEMGNFYKEEEYFSLEHFAKKHNIKNLKKEGLRKEIKKIRRKIYPNVKKFPNVGSTFGNTEVSKKECLELLKKYPQIPN